MEAGNDVTIETESHVPDDVVHVHQLTTARYEGLAVIFTVGIWGLDFEQN